MLALAALLLASGCRRIAAYTQADEPDAARDIGADLGRHELGISDRGTDDVAVPDVTVPDVGPPDLGPPPGAWVRRWGGTDHDLGSALAVDDSGNVYLTGYFRGQLLTSAGPLQSKGGGDILVVGVDAWGKERFVRGLGGGGNDQGGGIAVDAAQNIYLTGYLGAPTNLGGAPLKFLGTVDGFVASYTATGAHRFSRGFGGAQSDEGLALLLSASEVIALGVVRPTVVEVEGIASLSVQGQADGLVVAYGQEGSPGQVRQLGSGGYETTTAGAVDAQGRIYVTGQFNGTVNMGTGPLPATGLVDCYVVRLSTTLAADKAWRFGGDKACYARALAIDPNGDVLVAGGFSGNIKIGTSTLTSAGLSDAFIARFASDGSYVSSARFGGLGDDEARTISIAANGDTLLAGSFEKTIDFGGPIMTSAGAEDVFVVRQSPTGGHRWSRRFGSTAVDLAFALGMDHYGGIYVTGAFGDTVDFDGTVLKSAGSWDAFLLRLAP